MSTPVVHFHYIPVLEKYRYIEQPNNAQLARFPLLAHSIVTDSESGTVDISTNVFFNQETIKKQK